MCRNLSRAFCVGSQNKARIIRLDIQYNTILNLPTVHLGASAKKSVRATKTVQKKRNNLKCKITILKSI